MIQSRSTFRCLGNSRKTTAVGPAGLPGHEPGLSINVVFTDVQATLAALRRAGELAHQLGSYLRIIVPEVVPYPLPLDHPTVDPRFRARHVRTIASGDAIETRVEIRLCRDVLGAVRSALVPQSVVLIGGRKRWWPTRAARLARDLGRAGHHVIFVVDK